MTSRILKGLLAALLAAAPASAGVGTAGAPKLGEIAPDTRITLVDGTQIRLADLRGQVVLLNFWATWCVPCRTELPLLDRFYHLRKDAGLRVFAVTTEGSVPVRKLKGLFAAMAIPAARRIGAPYDAVKAVPTNYIIDRAGRLRYAKAAALDLDDLNRELIPLLREPAPAATAP